MRALVLPVLLCALALPGCSGFSIGVRQDSEDKEAFSRALAAQEVGSPFPARALLAKDWTRLFVFRGGLSTQAVEDRIGIPFPQSGEDVPADARYLVFADDEAVVSAFSYAGPRGVDPGCVLAERVPYAPATQLVLLEPARGGPAGSGRLSAVAAADRCR